VFEDDDPERLATHMYRAWNNAPVEIREHAWALLRAAAASGFCLVDEENPSDA
jgi:thymidylate synthase ThyX